MDIRYKCSLIFFFILFGFSASIDAMIINQGGGGGACTTPSTAYELNEGFIGGYEEGTGGGADTWTESEGDPTPDFTISGFPAGSCTKGLDINKTGTTEQVATYNIGSTVNILTDVVTIQLEWQWDSQAFPTGSTKFQYILTLNNSSTDITVDGAVRLVFERENSPEQFNIYADGSTNSADVEVAIDTPITIKLYLANGAGASYLKVDAGANQTFTANTGNCQYLHLGVARTDFNWPMRHQTGYIWMDIP